MKDYIYFAIRINIALILASFLVALAIVPLLIVFIAPLAGIFSLEAGDIESVTRILSFIFVMLVSFKVAHWIFKTTYKNSKLKKHLDLNKCILYSFGLGVIIDVIFYFADPEPMNAVAIASMVTSRILVLWAFYLAGKSVSVTSRTS